MRWKRDFSLLMPLACLLMFFPSLAYSQSSQGEATSEVIVPKDLTLSLELLSPISTAINQKGDKFTCKVLAPAEYADATVSGYIKSVKNAGKANGSSKLDLAFESITLKDGRDGNFNAQVTEVYDVANVSDEGQADQEGTVKSKSSRVKVSVKRAAAGALVGALIGGAIAGGKGAALGAAIGASVGVTSVLVADGPNLEFKQGTRFKVLTNGPSRRSKT